MYPSHRLETPPPASRFRRPWSPEPFDPNPRPDTADIERILPQATPQRREPSDDFSVEALDLADYAHTLARQPGTAQAAPVFQPYAAYPPSPQPFRSFSSRDSMSTPPLLSPAPSTAHSYSGASSRSSVPQHAQPNHRPFSLPAPAAHRSSPQSHPSYTSRHSAAHDHDPLRTPPLDPDTEIDIAQFPAFTRGWYVKPKALADDPLARYGPFQLDPFDPAFPTHEYNGYPTPPPLYSSPLASSYASHSPRDMGVVPWTGDPLEGRPVDAEVKEERMRMLEREFAGKNGVGSAEDEEHRVGSVDAKGRLITDGPKKRALVRWMQALLALLAGGSGIYAAAIIKPPSPPPPANKPPAYILYILSVLTFLLTTYLFLLYPVCCGARRQKDRGAPFTGGPGGMMVLPVQGLPGGKKSKKKGNKKDGNGDGGVQVNLIVDPSMFAGDRLDDDEADDETSESEHTIPGSYSDRSRRSRRARAAKRRGIFAGLAMEAQWQHARKMLKWGMAVDMIMLFLWGAEFVYILIGKRCPSGSFDGWCDAYNVATAASCLICLAFGFGVFFDIKDLHASNASPRTRT